MSNEPTNFQNVDNLTPFEYALAGVPVPEAQASPSLSVIEQMRQLAHEVKDAPISQPRLREFFQTGGSIAKRSDRRAGRRRGAASADVRSEGGFIDITPVELSEPTPPALTGSGGPMVLADEPAEPAVAGRTTADQPANRAAADQPAEPAVADEPADRAVADFEASTDELDQIDLVHASIQAELDDEPAADLQVEHGDEDDELRQAGFAPLSEAVLPASALLGLSEQAGAADPLLDPTEPLDRGQLVNAESDRPDVAKATPPVPKLFPELDRAPESDVHEGHLADPPLVFAEAILGADAPAADDRERAILVPAIGAAKPPRILNNSEMAGTGPDAAGLAAVTSVAAGPGPRFSGGTFWALAGTAAAAAALVVGGLWWTSGLNSRTQTESAQVSPGPIDDTARTEAGEGDAGGQSSQGGTPVGADEDGSQNTEFGARAASSTSTSDPRVGQSTTIVARTTTSIRRTTATTSVSTATSPTTDGVSTTLVGETSSTTTPEPGSTDPSAAEATTVPTTTRSTARLSTTVAQPLAFIGDAVTIGSFAGQGASGVRVELYDDPNRQGATDSLRANTVTSSTGRYGFNVPGGCYVVRFYPPNGYQIQSGQQNQALCVDAGANIGRVDAVIQPLPPPAGPSGCKVEPKGKEDYRGVEVFEHQSNWAESYTFYGDKGQVIVRTRDLGPPDDVEGPTNHEWQAAPNGYDHRKVYSVAAERNGRESAPVGCTRE